jgi:hypothetical protein
MQIVQEVYSEPPHMNQISHFVECIEQEFGYFTSSCVVHVHREANSAACTLAKEATTHSIDSVCLEDINSY